MPLDLKSRVYESLDNALENGYETTLTDSPEHVTDDLSEYDSQFERTAKSRLLPHVQAWQDAKRKTVGECRHCGRVDVLLRPNGRLTLHDDRRGVSCVANFLCKCKDRTDAGHPAEKAGSVKSTSKRRA